MTTVTLQVDRPASEVFAYATDPTKFHEWQQGVVSGKLESNGTPLGDRCLTVRRIGGAVRPSISELVRFDPPLAWSVRGIDGPIRARVDLTVDALSQSRSRLSIAVDFEGHGIGGCWCRSSCAVKRAPRCPRTSPGASTRSRLAP